jgi:2-polyprenyl-6-methoxyphenol hydroxylase-like FAD-dependent oxidoreductase
LSIEEIAEWIANLLQSNMRSRGISALRGATRGLSTETKQMRKMAVIGAGITGVTTARALMKRGFDVTVFDRHRYAAMETSFANGGQLSASNAEVWNSYGTILKGIKWMFQRDAPLLMNPLADISWHKYSWMCVRHRTPQALASALAPGELGVHPLRAAGRGN